MQAGNEFHTSIILTAK